ncbi:NADP-dependent oxidoreductase domain-containing protein [Crepidotus variabilis]|uniref:NADP-dependent oxidoreductase domain-containing protein n=1 Tax=Crepidotus variabilis TaxID=179855 RepID=A0A9P6ECZ2_9AGAR|nr:NADP-dependent oxidoreductase domain-containing protein [Crepidotus variabilis]
MSLATRKIGNDDVSEIGFGAMGLSVWYGKVPSDDERLKILDTVVEEGCMFLDTSDIYGDSELLLGQWFKKSGKRDQVFLCSKFGVTMKGPDREVQAEKIDNSAEYMKAALEDTLKRLGTDHLDLYYAHRVDKNTPIEKTVRALAELVKEGKVRHIGLSEVSAETLRRAHAVHPIAAVQVEYSPFALDIETNGVLQAAKELGVAVVAYSPLGRGILTGAIKKNSDFPEDDFRRYIPKFSQDNFPKILDVVHYLTAVGEKHNATPGQVTLAWLLAQAPNIIPIPGTKKVKYLKENLGAADIKLSSEELAGIRKELEQANLTAVERYPAMFVQDLYTDTVKE